MLARSRYTHENKIRHTSSFGSCEHLKINEALCFLVCSSMCKLDYLHCTVIREIRDLLREITLRAQPQGSRVIAVYNCQTLTLGFGTFPYGMR